MCRPPLHEYDAFVADQRRRRSFAGKEREVANVVTATVGWLIRPTQRTPGVKPALRSPRSSDADANPGWLSRHSSRFLYGAKPEEPYVDLSPLELSKRH
jgi:hypothetical protein